MTTQTVNFCTTNQVPSCQCLYPRPVIFCVPEVLTASGQPFLTGTLTNVQKAGNACSCVYKYTIEYDDADLADPTSPLTPPEVSGIFCTDCFTTWIEEISGAAFCLEVTDTETVDLIVTTEVDNPCDILSANVNISEDVGNIIEARTDGLYASGSEASDAWLLVGNAGTVEGTNFLGTTDNIDFQIRQNNEQVGLFTKRNATNYDGHDVIFGGQQNNISAGSRGSGNTISGGGPTGFPNVIEDSGTPGSYNASCVIAGGEDNRISEVLSDFSWANVIAGGVVNICEDQFYSVIGGGLVNQIYASGLANEAGSGNVICGGISNIIIDDDSELLGVICGGQGNFVYRTYAGVIVGGDTNLNQDGIHCAILNGYRNVLDGASYSSVLGGARLTLGSYSIGYQSPASFNVFAGPSRDLSAFSGIAYFGDVDLWAANSDGTARKLKLIEPNTDVDFSSANYTSLRSQAQAANIDYIMPAATGVATDVLSISGVSGTDVTLAWAAAGGAGLTGWSTDGSGNFNQTAGFTGNIVFDAAFGTIRQDTLDGTDTKGIIVAGGGGTTSARGSLVILYGNEHATAPGQAWYSAGLNADHKFITDNGGGSLTRWSFAANGTLAQDGNDGSDLVFNRSPFGIIRQGTSDGADNKGLVVAGGGGIASARGGFIALYGNELLSAPGNIQYVTGVGAGAGADHQFYTDVGAGNVLRWSFTNNGTLTQDVTNGSSLIMSRDIQSVLLGTSSVDTDITAVAASLSKLTMQGNSGTGFQCVNVQVGANTSGAAYTAFKTRAADGSANTAVNNGDAIAYWYGYGADGTVYDPVAGITYEVDGALGTGVPGKIKFQTSTSLAASLVERWSINSSGQFVQDGTNGEDIVLNVNNTVIRMGTTDGTDNKQFSISGGGDAGADRGGYINFYGNEVATHGGKLQYFTGRAGGTGAPHQFHTDPGSGSVLRWSFEADGDLSNDATDGGNIIFQKATTAIQLQSGANGRTGTFSINGSTPVTVNNTSLAAGDQIIITRDTPAGTPGDWHLTARVNGTSFEVIGSALDTSGMRYTLIRIN